MLKITPHITKAWSFVKSLSACCWQVLKREQGGIVAVTAIIAIVLSFCAYHQTRQAMKEQTKANRASIELASNTLSLQAKEFRLRTRPIVVISPIPVVRDAGPQDTITLAMDPNSRKQIVFSIKNVADIPATRLLAGATIITIGEKGRVQESIQETRVPTLAKDESFPIVYSVTDKVWARALQGPWMRFRINVRYEGLSQETPGWFETFLEVSYQPVPGGFREEGSHQKAFWDQPRPESSFEIDQKTGEVQPSP